MLGNHSSLANRPTTQDRLDLKANSNPGRPLIFLTNSTEGTIVITMELKEATYPSRIPGFVGDPIWFKYVVIEETNQVFFSGVEQKGTSTVNAAPNVILTICEAAKISPESFEFFDVLTHRGIPGKKPGYCQIEQLHIQGEGTHLRITSRRIVAIAQDNADQDEKILEALPNDHQDAFVRLIRE